MAVPSRDSQRFTFTVFLQGQVLGVGLEIVSADIGQTDVTTIGSELGSKFLKVGVVALDSEFAVATGSHA